MPHAWLTAKVGLSTEPGDRQLGKGQDTISSGGTASAFAFKTLGKNAVKGSQMETVDTSAFF